jgi:polar amino acid transport system substrate-binding protein/glutamate/aspartate transport system substrate-binding protein
MREALRGLLLSLSLLLPSVSAFGDALDDIGAKGVVNLGYRTDAAPLSFLDGSNRPAGFSVDLCRRIVEDIGKAVGKPVTANFVSVGTHDRFTALENRTIDILCGADTVTLQRREEVDFTLLTFVAGGTFMTRASAPPIDIRSDKVSNIGVLARTTSEAALRKLVDSGTVKMNVVPVDTHDVAIGFLMSNVLDGYFGDDQLLLALKSRTGNPSALDVSTDLVTLEPYALAVKRGEDRLRLLSDRTLAGLYRSGEVYRIIEPWFPQARPGALLRALYTLQGFAEE